MKPHQETSQELAARSIIDRRTWIKRTALVGIGAAIAGFLTGRVQGVGSSKLIFQDDYIWLKVLTANPSPLPQGGLWWRDDLPRIVYSPDGAATRQVAALEDALSSFSGGGITAVQHGALGAIVNAHAFADLSGGITTTQHGALLGPASAHRHADLASIGVDDHHAQLHAAAHHSGGGDLLALASIPGSLIAAQHPSGLGIDLHHAQAHKVAHVSGGGDAFASTDFIDAIVARLRVTGPVDLLLGAVADGQYLRRSGTGIIGDAGSAGAPVDADYLVGTAHAGLSAEIVVGTAPGGELGGTWASPTVDATHAGSAHHAEDHKARHVSGDLDGFVSTDVLEAIIKRIQESGGPTTLLIGAISDGQFLKRSGTNVVGDPGGGGGDNISVNAIAATDADFDDATPAPPAGRKNVKWQKDALTPNNISAYMDDVVTVLAREVTLITIVSSVAETDIFNQTIPANAMNSNRMLRLTILYDRLNNSGASETAATFRVYTGGTVRYADAGLPLPANAARVPGRYELTFAMQNATNMMILNGHLRQHVAGGATTGLGNKATDETGEDVPMASDGTFTQDTTVNWALRVTMQLGTNNANVDFRRHYAILELL